MWVRVPIKTVCLLQEMLDLLLQLLRVGIVELRIELTKLWNQLQQSCCFTGSCIHEKKSSSCCTDVSDQAKESARGTAFAQKQHTTEDSALRALCALSLSLSLCALCALSARSALSLRAPRSPCALCALRSLRPALSALSVLCAIGTFIHTSHSTKQPHTPLVSRLHVLFRLSQAQEHFTTMPGIVAGAVGFVVLAALVCCCCCCVLETKQQLALWLGLPQGILDELGVPKDNEVKLAIPKLGCTPDQIFKEKTRDGRVITFKVVSEEPYITPGTPVQGVAKGVAQPRGSPA